MEVSPQEFLALAESFVEVTPHKAEALLEERAGHIVFIGRETCPFCRKFISQLHKVSQDNDLTVHFLHSQHPDYVEDTEVLRAKYDVPTVPGLLYSDETTEVVKSVCNSSMSEEDIKAFINL